MSLTPHRDAAAATCIEARRRYQARGSHGPIADILNRMDVDTAEALMLGYGDLMDLEVPAGACGDMVIRVLASALASFLATASGGQVSVATSLIDGALAALRRRTHERLSRIDSEGIMTTVAPQKPRGQA